MLHGKVDAENVFRPQPDELWQDVYTGERAVHLNAIQFGLQKKSDWFRLSPSDAMPLTYQVR